MSPASLKTAVDPSPAGAIDFEQLNTLGDIARYHARERKVN